MRLRSLLVLLVLPFFSDAVTFTNPIKTKNGSDPFMVFWEGYYYLTTTTWTNIQITRATTIAGLKTATPTTVWTDSTAVRCCNVWAPEIHRINGRWYIYYTAGATGTAYTTNQKIWVLQGGTDTPMDTYTFLSQMIPPNNNVAILDGTVFPMSNGNNYFIYSAWGTGGQSLWISLLTGANSVGPSTKISSPQYSWEEQGASVNEGPQGLSHNGKDYLFYSASYCATQYYELGMLTLTGTDPLSVSSWTKKSTPVFVTGNGEYGPGHNGFFTSPDGTESWIVYHANTAASGVCDGNRETFVQKVNFDSSGVPALGTPVGIGVTVQPPSGEGTVTTAPTSTASVTTASTVRVTTTTTAHTTTTTSSGTGGTAAHWGQCGGIGWTGPTQCAAPYTCQVGNPYYSQCL